MKNAILPILSLLFVSVLATGQTSGAFERAAAKYLADGNYYGAMVTYGKMLAIDSADAKGWAGFAEAARLQGAFEQSEAAYQRIFDGKTKLHDPLAPFWLAGVKQDQGKFTEATALYEQFVAAPGGADSSYVGLAKQRMKTCDYAKKHEGNLDLDVEVTKLPEPINSPEGEYAPSLMGDALYFSSNREEWGTDKNFPKRLIYKVYSGKMSDNGSTLAKADFNEKELHTANTSFSADGHWMFYSVGRYITDAKIESRLWRREKMVDGAWANAMELPEPINAPVGYTTTEPNVAVDAAGNDVLFFVSDRPNGRGGLDIYKTTLLKDGTYSNPENLSALNTMGDDITPNWHRKSNTLYFSSNGRASLGGFDVFKSEFKNGYWTPVTHLPPPTNSYYNDAYYSILPDETGALFCSNRREATKQIESMNVCCYDIFKAEFLGIDLVVINFNKKSKDSLRMVNTRLVELTDCKNKHGEEVKVDVPGAFTHFTIERGKCYMLISQKPDFTTDTTIFSTKDLPKTERKLVQKLYLQPAEIDLTAYCFDKSTGKELVGTTMRFEEIVGGKRFEEKSNNTGNDYFYGLDWSHKYRLIASKMGYRGDTVVVSTEGYDRIHSVHLKEKLYLEPSLQSYLPLAVFFDNDCPDKRVTRATTTTTYGQSYELYDAASRKGEFISNWNKANPAMNQFEKLTMETFFSDKVEEGWKRLGLLSAALKERLDKGEHVELTIRGYASPRAKNDYNKKLTGRRIWSLKNHFSVWNGGALNEYIENQQLTFVEDATGEETANAEAKNYEDIRDEANTIYSIRASYERRVEIVEAKNSAGPVPAPIGKK